MMKLVLYSVMLAALFPLAASAKDGSRPNKRAAQRMEMIRSAAAEEDADFIDSMRTVQSRDIPAMQDTTGRRRRIKEVPASRPQTKPERLRPPGEPADGDNGRQPGNIPGVDRGGARGGDRGGFGGQEPAGFGGDHGGMRGGQTGGGGGNRGGDGNGGGRQAPPPPRR